MRNLGPGLPPSSSPTRARLFELAAQHGFNLSPVKYPLVFTTGALIGTGRIVIDGNEGPFFCCRVDGFSAVSAIGQGGSGSMTVDIQSESEPVTDGAVDPIAAFSELPDLAFDDSMPGPIVCAGGGQITARVTLDAGTVRVGAQAILDGYHLRTPDGANVTNDEAARFVAAVKAEGTMFAVGLLNTFIDSQSFRSSFPIAWHIARYLRSSANDSTTSVSIGRNNLTPTPLPAAFSSGADSSHVLRMLMPAKTLLTVKTASGTTGNVVSTFIGRIFRS